MPTGSMIMPSAWRWCLARNLIVSFDFFGELAINKLLGVFFVNININLILCLQFASFHDQKTYSSAKQKAHFILATSKETNHI